jgi:hypothetical protein
MEPKINGKRKGPGSFSGASVCRRIPTCGMSGESINSKLTYPLSSSYVGLTRVSIAFGKMDCRVKPGNDKN